MRPQRAFMTRDMVAHGQGTRTPPHIEVVAEVHALRVPARACARLAQLARAAGSHLGRQQPRRRSANVTGVDHPEATGGHRELEDPILRDERSRRQEVLHEEVPGGVVVCRVSGGAVRPASPHGRGGFGRRRDYCGGGRVRLSQDATRLLPQLRRVFRLLCSVLRVLSRVPGSLIRAPTTGSAAPTP